MRVLCRQKRSVTVLLYRKVYFIPFKPGKIYLEFVEHYPLFTTARKGKQSCGQK
jgi:hypothetical protein